MTTRSKASAKSLRRHPGAGRVGVLGVLLLSVGCSSVRTRIDSRESNPRIKRAECVRIQAEQTFFLETVDAPGLISFKTLTTLTAGAKAPFPLREDFQGPAWMTYDDQISHESFPGTADWKRQGESWCLTFRGAWRQGHLAMSAPTGPDGRLQMHTDHPIEIGPWCRKPCP